MLFVRSVEQTVARCTAIFEADEHQPQLAADGVMEEGPYDLDQLTATQCWNLLSTLFAAIPTASSVLAFFRPVVPRLSAALAQVPFVPTMSGCFLPPTAVLFLPSTFAKDLPWVDVSEKLLQASKKSFVHADLGMNSEVASALGIQAQAGLFLSLLEAAHKAWQDIELSEAQMKWLAQTLNALRRETSASKLKVMTRELNSMHCCILHNPITLDHYGIELRVLPLLSCRSASLNAGAIYELAGGDDLKLLEGVRILHPVFVQSMVENQGQAVLAILKIARWLLAELAKTTAVLIQHA